MLRAYVHPRQDDWDKYLGLLEFAYNNSVQASTGQTPFFLNLGRHPATPFDRALPRESQVPAANEFLETLADATQAAKDNIRAAQQRQAAHADRARRECTFKVGDQVMMSTKNLRMPAGLSSKLTAKFMGPFEIVRQASPVAFELSLPATVKIHPVFHASLLKYHHPPVVVSEDYTRPGPVYADRTGAYYEVDRVLGKRRIRMGSGRTQWQYLVSWKGYPASDNSWQPAKDVVHLKEDIERAPDVTPPAGTRRTRRT
jgi:hypothetical protein